MGRFSDFITRNARRKLQGQISDLLGKIQVNGLSYSNAITLLSYVPNEQEFEEHFNILCQKVDFFLKTQNDVLLKEISKSEIDNYKNVIAVKVFVVNDWDFYSIDNIAFYLKEDDRGYRMLVQKDWFDREPYNYHKEYPKNICMGYCGCGGDVNRAYESDALYKMDRFFTFGPIQQEKRADKEYATNNDYEPHFKEATCDEDACYEEESKCNQLLTNSNTKAISMELLKYKEKTYFVWEDKQRASL